MKEVVLIGGPLCGAMVTVRTGQNEYRVALAGTGAWPTAHEKHPATHHRIGVYAPRDRSDAVLGRWTWKEPT